ncbi:MAG TPA: hypothetical protein DD706_15170 [Nitrospiraceae bacterium]|nr:hypothetical protein [Nitrospiraceae bacterium]
MAPFVAPMIKRKEESFRGVLKTHGPPFRTGQTRRHSRRLTVFTSSFVRPFVQTAAALPRGRRVSCRGWAAYQQEPF